MSNGCTVPGEAAGAPDHLDKKEILCRLKEFPARPLYPPASDRKAWGKIDQETKERLIRDAEKILKKPWPQLTANAYMQFRRTGSRLAYETPYWAKRHKLITLVLGECSEYSGRFTDEIIEGIWQILAEPVWCVAAHEALPPGELFPDPSRFKIDLFSSSTGKMFCDILSLLESDLNKKSPFLVRRIKMEVMRRVVEPAEQLNDENTWWFCGRNNWTPWCSVNITGCAIYLLNDQPERLAEIINTYLGISRRFYNRYPADGGCNEGPSYWRHAPGKYFQLLQLVDNRLNLEGKPFADAKLKRMFEYLPGMNLSGGWFLSTNDAPPGLASDAAFLAFVAQKSNSSSLLALAQQQKKTKLAPAKVTELDGLLISVFSRIPEKKLSVVLPAVSYWENLGICILREKPASPEKGTVISLKGGHNAESHNHLDLGHFSVFNKNKPYIVDIGAGVYTAATFSTQRYTLWNLNSTGHNAPRFSGKGQENDAKYTAKITVEGDSVTRACLDRAYPESAGVKSLQRTVTLDRKTGRVTVSDTAAVDGKKKIQITLFTAVEPVSFDARSIKWARGTLVLRNLKAVQVVPEERLDDAMKKNWGRLWRIELTGTVTDAGSWGLDFDFSK